MIRIRTLRTYILLTKSSKIYCYPILQLCQSDFGLLGYYMYMYKVYGIFNASTMNGNAYTVGRINIGHRVTYKIDFQHYSFIQPDL